MKIVFATGNSGKLREAQEILGEGFELVTPAEMGITEEIPETGTTLRANSIQKADYIKTRCGCNCFADDTGLEVDILGGAPGIHSARYATDGHDFEANMNKLLLEMARAEKEASLASKYIGSVKMSRNARFKTVVTLLLDGRMLFFDGVVEGKISLVKTGDKGFGYDPVFIPNEIPSESGSLIPNTCKLSMAELSDEAKNAISHRGKAMRAMADYLHSL